MAAEILEDFEEHDNPEQQSQESDTPITDDLSTFETEAQEPEVSEAQTEETDDEIPEKYRGKSPAELARMHQEAEKLLGKQSQEVGEYRKLFDQHVQGQLSQVNQQQEPEEEVDFFEDPDTAVSRAIERHPTVQRANQTAEEYQKQMATQRLQAAHPDAGEILRDDKFKEWVESTPLRKNLYDTANQQYNPDLASELLTLYKERAESVKQVAQAEETERKRQVQRASTGNTGGASQGGSGKRIYRRTDIIKLMKQDPDRYESLSGEIMKAYQEGRVR